MSRSAAGISRRHRHHPSLIESLEPRRLMSGTWSTVDSVPSQFDFPVVSGMTADKAGNVYAIAADSTYNAVLYLREKPAGSATWITVIAVNGLQWEQFNGVAIDTAGDVFITGKTSSQYFATWELAKGTTTLKQIDVDSVATGVGEAVTTDQSGNVYAVGYDHTRSKSSTAAKWTVRKGTFANGRWSFSTIDQPLQSQGEAFAVTATATGIYVGGAYNGVWTIRKSATGASGTWSTVDGLSTGAPHGIATDAAGNIYAVGQLAISNTTQWIVRESTNGGSSWTTVDDFIGTFTSATAAAITRDASGNMVVAGSGSENATGDYFAVVRTNAGGSWSTADNYGYPDGSAYYDAVAADSFGNLYAGGEVYDNAATFDDWMIRSQPAAPTNLAAAADATNPTSQINLSWINAAGSDQSGFAIYRSSDGGATFTLVATVSAGITTYSDSGLTAGASYSYYVVTLLNTDGASNASNTASASTAAI